MIAIVNYGSGNVQAIANILSQLEASFVIASTPSELMSADRAILPGVGAFDQAMGELDRSGLRQGLETFAMEHKRSVLGICVGMQLLAKGSEEGNAPGLGWIDGIVRRIGHEGFPPGIHLPHMGWNTVEPSGASRLFRDVDLSAGYYFLHSFYFACKYSSNVVGRTNYGIEFASAVAHENIYGVQFHPEKSHQAGIQLFRNFATGVL